MGLNIQKNRKQQYRVEHRSFSNLSVVLALSGLLWLPQQVLATTTDQRFQQYINDICAGNTTPPPGVVWDMATIGEMCVRTQGGAAGSVISANLGITNAGGGLSTYNKKSVRELESEKKKSEKAASADGGGWGFLVTPQYGKSIRAETDLENGYKSTLSGLLVGLDYRFSDSFVLGTTTGQIKDDAKFYSDAGSLKTSNNTLTLYGTWLPSDSVAVDGYLGYGKINFDSLRQVVFGGVSFGKANGNTTGKQSLAGMSVSYQANLGQLNLAPFINLDYIKTSIKGYNESGTTTMEMRYGDRSVSSLASSLGGRLSASHSYGWGALLPSLRLAAVHEFQNKVRQISNELVSTPGAGFLVETDSPDRNYLNLGLGVTAALNGGTLMFIDYDKRAKDRLLDSWAVSAGVLVEF